MRPLLVTALVLLSTAAAASGREVRPADGGFIALLFNDGDGSYSESTRRLTRDLARIVRGLPVEAPRPGLARALTKVLLEQGVATARAMRSLQ